MRTAIAVLVFSLSAAPLPAQRLVPDSAVVQVYDTIRIAHVTPEVATGVPGDTVRFFATVTNEAGDELDVDVGWASSDPSGMSIHPISGLATLLSEGRYWAIATPLADGDTAITPPPVIDPDVPDWPAGEPIYFNSFESDDWAAEQNGVHMRGQLPGGSLNRGCRRALKDVADAPTGSRVYSLNHEGVWGEGGNNCEQYFRLNGPTSPFADFDGIPVRNGFAVEFKWKVPADYMLVSQPDNWANQKLIALFQCAYSGCPTPEGRVSDFKMVQEFVPFEDRLEADSVTTQLRPTSAMFRNTTAREALTSVLISEDGPIVPGEWATIRFCIQPASTSSASDGFYRTWANGVVVAEYRGSVWGRAMETEPYLTGGYFFGAANPYINGPTEFQVDDFAIYLDSTLCEGEYGDPMMSFPRNPVDPAAHWASVGG